MLKRKSQQFCIYCLVDPNPARRDVFYIGKARQNTLTEVRWRHSNNRNNPRKYHSIQRLLRENKEYEIVVLKENLSEERAFELEKFLIKVLTNLGFDLVNLTGGGEGTSGYRHSKEVCKMRSKRMKKKNPMKNNKVTKKASTTKRKAVSQYSLDGKLLKTFDSAITIEEKFGFFRQNISSCCRGEYNTMYGYVWRYADA